MATINFKGENLIMERIEKRTLDLAWYMIENQATARDLARVFSMSKSTVHNYLTTKLPDISGPMAQAVRDVLAFNWKERSIRGGNATREKYCIMRESNLIK